MPHPACLSARPGSPFSLFLPSVHKKHLDSMLGTHVCGTCPTTAAACVGDMLYTGTGCLQDYGEALRYYLRAAHAGESTSANAVGLMHELGRGAVRDLAAAAEWYARAADLG